MEALFANICIDMAYKALEARHHKLNLTQTHTHTNTHLCSQAETVSIEMVRIPTTTFHKTLYKAHAICDSSTGKGIINPICDSDTNLKNNIT